MTDDEKDPRPRSTSRRTLLAGGAGAALVTGAAAVVPAGPAAADDTSVGGRHHPFETRVRVAPGVHVNVADLRGGHRGTFVLIPGWPLASTTLEYTSLFLADHGYRVVVLDQRGFGKSDAPYAPYTYDVWCHDIRAVIEALRLRDVTLVGHSMGGAIVLRYAARFRTGVARLVLAEAPTPAFVYGAQSAALTTAINGLVAGYAANRSATVRGITGNFFSTHTDITTDPLLQFFERQCLDQASLQASRAGLVALRDSDLAADLGRVRVPTRVFHAVHDRIVPYDHGQATAAGIRGARLVTFETAGHGVYVDERDKFNHELLAFAG